MAIFSEAYKITMDNEGGYSNDPHDHGGETWRGIARNFWPQWEGWKIVDTIKSEDQTDFCEALKANEPLETLVLAFYQTHFWDCLSLTLIDCQQIGNQLFDISVNMGSKIGARMLQEAINSFANNSITVDEEVGAETIDAANKLDMQNLYDKINELRTDRYEQIIAENPSQEIFKHSWFSRIKPFEDSNSSMA